MSGLCTLMCFYITFIKECLKNWCHMKFLHTNIHYFVVYIIMKIISLLSI